MRIDWAIPCHSVTFYDGGELVDIRRAGIDTRVAESLPADVRFTLLLRAKGAVEEFAIDAERRVEIRTELPDGGELDTVHFELEPREPDPEYPVGWEPWMFIEVEIRFRAAHVGPHLLQVELNHRHCQTVPIWVMLAEGPDA